MTTGTDDSPRAATGGAGGTGLFPVGGFRWLTGIEDTCVHAPSRYGMPPLDEFELTGHDGRWRDDLRLAVDLGSEAVRYGIGWPRVHIAPGRFDWSRIDERVGFARDLGLGIVADLVHYGTPTWLEGSFADPGYVDAAEEYSRAFAERYRDAIPAVTPLNEPLTTASFSGLRTVWPPALGGWDGWARVTVAIARGIAAATAAIRAEAPGMTLVHVEASAIYESDDPRLDAHTDELRMLGDLPTDLVLGRLGDRARLWLERHGVDGAALDSLAASPATVDILGVNYYPDLTPRLVIGSPEQPRQRATDRGGIGLEAVLRHAAQRWSLPLVITETSIEGDESTRAAWLASAAATADRLRDEGLDLRGFTWWPLLDFVDWSWAAQGSNVEEFEVPPATLTARADAHRAGSVGPFLRRMGLVRLDDHLTRHPDASARMFAALSRHPARSLD